jgi:hypothetical protein
MGRKGMLALAGVLTAVSLFAATAAADPLPAGNYSAQLTGVSLTMGGVVGTQTFTLNGLPVVPFTVPANQGPVSVAFGNVTVPTVDLHALAPSQLADGSTLSVTLTGPITLNADPTAGSGSGHVSGYVTAVLVSGLGSATCKFGSAESPIDITLSTGSASGQPYNAATGVVKIADDAISVPTPACTSSNPAVTAIVPTLVSLATGTGNAKVVFSGLIKPVPPAGTPGGGTPQNSQPQVTSQPACVVPSLAGKKLRAARRALTAAHCRLGKVTVQRSVRRRWGRVLSSRPRAGTRRRVGAAVDVTVGGPRSSRRH